MNKKGWLVAFLLVGALATASAQSLAKDLKTLIDATGLKYDVTKSGNVAVTYSLDDDRSQVVYITAKASKVGDVTVREVWSNSGTFESQPDAEQMVALMTAAERIGAWNLEESDGGYLAYFSTTIPMSISGKELSSVLEFVATVADKHELDTFDSDDN